MNNLAPVAIALLLPSYGFVSVHARTLGGNPTGRFSGWSMNRMLSPPSTYPPAGREEAGACAASDSRPHEATTVIISRIRLNPLNLFFIKRTRKALRPSSSTARDRAASSRAHERHTADSLPRLLQSAIPCHHRFPRKSPRTVFRRGQ